MDFRGRLEDRLKDAHPREGFGPGFRALLLVLGGAAPLSGDTAMHRAFRVGAHLDLPGLLAPVDKDAECGIVAGFAVRDPVALPGGESVLWQCRGAVVTTADTDTFFPLVSSASIRTSTVRSSFLPKQTGSEHRSPFVSR